MTYSSFGRRLGAYLIDFLLLSPLFALQIWASGHSISMAILSAVLVSVAFIGYREDWTKKSLLAFNDLHVSLSCV